MWPFSTIKRLQDYERRYLILRSRCFELHRWMDGEAADAAQWLFEGDRDHWRRLDEKPTGTLPSGISEFREHLYRLRDKARAS